MRLVPNETAKGRNGASAKCAARSRRFAGSPARRFGFSLVEVLLAIFILGIGMIMVASVFPVGANWTRQTTEESVGEQIAQDAMTVVRTYYGPGGALAGQLNPLNMGDAGTLVPQDPLLNYALGIQVMPNFILIPVQMRSYQFGSATPYPTSNTPTTCTYYWTALCRLNPGQDRDGTGAYKSSASYKYDVYILVFKKGAVEQVFSPIPAEIMNTRRLAAPYTETYVPMVVRGAYSQGNANPGGAPSVINAVPAMGGIGIGAWSGTVFTQRFDATNSLLAIPRPMIMKGPLAGPPFTLPPNKTEPVIFAPPANGTNTSPLIYVYQTTLTM